MIKIFSKVYIALRQAQGPERTGPFDRLQGPGGAQGRNIFHFSFFTSPYGKN
ncbi:MAG TPA: hypothetical protein VIK10_02120 [Prolixibacteraceae bacterium]